MTNVMMENIHHLSRVLAHVPAGDPKALKDLCRWFRKMSRSSRITVQPQGTAVSEAAARVLEHLVNADQGKKYKTNFKLLLIRELESMGKLTSGDKYANQH